MNLSITVKRKFKINGKEYDSIDEMPAEIRDKFKKTMGMLADSGDQSDTTMLQKRIVFNAALGADETDAASPAIDLAKPGGGMRGDPEILGKVRSGHVSQPTRYEASFSARILIVSVVLGALFYLAYHFLHGRL